MSEVANVAAIIAILGTVIGAMCLILKKITSTLCEQLITTRNDYQANVAASTKAVGELANAVQAQTSMFVSERKLSGRRHKELCRILKTKEGE